MTDALFAIGLMWAIGILMGHAVWGRRWIPAATLDMIHVYVQAWQWLRRNIHPWDALRNLPQYLRSM